MSKKKATMTLKDFHGGSIPSDLPLPSAPGVIMRPSDRGGFDRQTSWGNSMGRSDHRLRPSSAGSTRKFDDKTPFLSNSPYIGRNFDEDERKPLDGSSGPRRTVSDENIHDQPAPILGHNLPDAIGSWPATVPASYISSGSAGGSYAGRVGDVHNVRFNYENTSGSRSFGSNKPNIGGNSGHPGAGSSPNPWGIRKGSPNLKEPVPTAWSAPEAAAKLAHASALEKISSGRWNSKQFHPQKDAEILGQMETDGDFYYRTDKTYNKNNYDRLGAVGDADNRDVSLVMHAQRSLVVDDGIHGGSKEMPTYEKFKSTSHAVSFERNSSIDNGPRASGKAVGAEFQSTLPTESSLERPKLKLLPRTKPLESSEPPVDYMQVYLEPIAHIHVEDSHRINEPMPPAQSFVSGSVVSDRGPERPKLNLKPRSQTLEQLDASVGDKRGTVFGGARPREVVLKERGIDDVAVGNYESQQPLRVKEDSPKVNASVHVASARQGEKTETIPGDQTRPKADRRDHQLDADRADPQRRNRRNEGRRNNRESEKQHNQLQQQIQNRPTSPDTWRKPVEHPRPGSSENPPVGYGKVASTVEFVQAFSKSVSDPRVADSFSGPRGLDNRNQVPFSRLMGPTPRPQINGY